MAEEMGLSRSFVVHIEDLIRGEDLFDQFLCDHTDSYSYLFTGFIGHPFVFSENMSYKVPNLRKVSDAHSAKIVFVYYKVLHTEE